jgi:hypothetical protein
MISFEEMVDGWEAIQPDSCLFSTHFTAPGTRLPDEPHFSCFSHHRPGGNPGNEENAVVLTDSLSPYVAG